MIDKKIFDVVLDIDDENFTANLIKALGIKPGDKINFIAPQFERVDGRAITYLPYTPEEYKALKNLEPTSLIKIGCQKWNEKEGKIHWLYPHEWYDHIPNDTEVVSISGEVEKFKHGETDNDKRYGALAYGFIQQIH